VPILPDTSKSTQNAKKTTYKSNISTSYANKITNKAGRLFRHKTAQLDIYRNCKNIFPTTPIRNIIFKLVK
jgi:hypothetical protein